MDFTEEILKRVETVKSYNNREQMAGLAEQRYQVNLDKVRSFTDFDAAFMQLFTEGYGEEKTKLVKKEHYQMVEDYFRSFYGSSRINFMDHIKEFGIKFPTRKSEKWSLGFEIIGGDLVVFLGYEGFKFKRISAVG